MTRVQFLMSLALGTAGVIAAMAPAQASVADDARRICTERFASEQAGGTIPTGMTKAQYLRQCQGSFVKNARLTNAADRTDDEFESDDSADHNDPDGKGGPEILGVGNDDDAVAARPAPKAPAKPRTAAAPAAR